MKTTSHKIKKLAEQKEKLETELKELMKERNAYVVDCLDALPSQNIPTEIIMGGLIHIIDTYNTNATSNDVEVWQKSGEKFCRRITKKKKSDSKNPNSTAQKQQKTTKDFTDDS